MGVHIYTGSLVRYYTNDWENEIQRWARENGVEYRHDYSGAPPKWPSSQVAAEHLAWMKSVLAGASWNDDIEAYHTIKLHQEGREALAIVAAHLLRPDLPMPTTMPAEEYDDVAYAEASKKGYLIGPIAAFDAGLVVRGSSDGVTLVESPLGEKVITCSAEFLRAALQFVEKNYLKGAIDRAAWLERGLAYARNSRSSKQDGSGRWIEETNDEPVDSLRRNAEFAYSVYMSILDFSDRHDTAIAVW